MDEPEPRLGADLYWIPLGAGGHVVRLSGRIYEAAGAWIRGQPRRDLYHSALMLELPDGRYTIEQAPAMNDHGDGRGVAVVGPVGTRIVGRLRLFRYEVRGWRDGVIPDLAHAVASPVRVSGDVGSASRILELVPSVPPLVWGRDERRTGDMWNSNSVISWLLVRAGVNVATIRPPAGGRAPGWRAGVEVARRYLDASGADRP